MTRHDHKSWLVFLVRPYIGEVETSRNNGVVMYVVLQIVVVTAIITACCTVQVRVDWCVSEAEINAASNEGYESVAGEVNRASTNDDITLCENTLYARDPEYDEGRSQGIFII